MARPRAKASSAAQQGGVGLIEVLIALLVLSVGLLGMAALQARSLTMTTESLQRTQALILANDIIERARANRQNVANYAIGFAATTPLACVSDFTIDNDSVSDDDLNEWRNNLACLLSNGNGRVEVNGNNIVVTITWQDRTETDADNNTLIDNRDRITLGATI